MRWFDSFYYFNKSLAIKQDTHLNMLLSVCFLSLGFARNNKESPHFILLINVRLGNEEKKKDLTNKEEN